MWPEPSKASFLALYRIDITLIYVYTGRGFKTNYSKVLDLFIIQSKRKLTVPVAHARAQDAACTTHHVHLPTYTCTPIYGQKPYETGRETDHKVTLSLAHEQHTVRCTTSPLLSDHHS